jgi:hypothetical protein
MYVRPMNAKLWCTVGVAMLVAACKANDATPASGSRAIPGPGSGAGSTISAPDSAPREGSSAGSATAASGEARGAGSADPTTTLDPKIAAARCDEPCLFLVDTPIAKLGDSYQAACGKDMPPLPFDNCTELDQLRKCVYAAHGFVFKQKKWKKFAKQPWYTPHPEFKPTQITELERANVRELDAVAKGCKTGLSVSTADLGRAKAWISALAAKHAPLPKIALVNGEPATREELFDFLEGQLQSQPLALDDETTVTYASELPTALVEAIKPAANTKLRSIVIDHGSTNTFDKDNPITEGVQIHMIYDDHDSFLGIDIAHYLYD